MQGQAEPRPDREVGAPCRGLGGERPAQAVEGVEDQVAVVVDVERRGHAVEIQIRTRAFQLAHRHATEVPRPDRHTVLRSRCERGVNERLPRGPLDPAHLCVAGGGVDSNLAELRASLDAKRRPVGPVRVLSFGPPKRSVCLPKPLPRPPQPLPGALQVLQRTLEIARHVALGRGDPAFGRPQLGFRPPWPCAWRRRARSSSSAPAQRGRRRCRRGRADVGSPFRPGARGRRHRTAQERCSHRRRSRARSRCSRAC